jgi:hypothetical protein
MARITTVSLRSPMTAVTNPAATKTRIMVLANCSASSRQAGLRSPLDQVVGAKPSQAVGHLLGG